MNTQKTLIKVAGFYLERGVNVTIEGPSIESVTSPDAKRLAIKAAAANGYSNCGISTTTGPYLVDSEGKTATGKTDTEKWFAESAIVTSGKFAYRNTFNLLQAVMG